MTKPPYGRRYATPVSPLTGPTPRPKGDTLPPDSSDIYIHEREHTNPSIIESIFHEALAAQGMTLERAIADLKRPQAPWLAFVSLGASLLLFAATWYVYRDIRSSMREDAADPAVPAVAPLAKRVEQTETRFDGIDERIGRLEAGVDRVLELLEPQADATLPSTRRGAR